METTKNCPQYVNTFRPRQCVRHFTDNLFKLIQIAPNCIQNAPRFKNEFGSALCQIESTQFRPRCFNTFRPRQCGCHLLTFSNEFPFIKLLYFLSQFNLKHGGYLPQTQSLDTSNILWSKHNDCHFTDKSWMRFSCMAIVVPFWKFHLNLKIH